MPLPTKKNNVVQTILAGRGKQPGEELVSAYASSNIALVKYWGKRNTELNLPVTSSLSVSLGSRGVVTSLQLLDQLQDEIILNETKMAEDSRFSRRLTQFLSLFRPKGMAFRVVTQANLPVAAGLASSAAGFAALVFALNLLFEWQLADRELSILARLGSGSACRSIWSGFVEWHAGSHEDGMDSYAEPLDLTWPELRIGLLIDHPEEKAISSRDAMKKTVETSPFYPAWPIKVAEDLVKVKEALEAKDFEKLGEVAESNALAMHATMLTASPSILYWQPQTVDTMHRVWQLRKAGVPVYFTEDAGANLKLIFLAKDELAIQSAFPKMELVAPFEPGLY